MSIMITEGGFKIDVSQFPKCKTKNCPGTTASSQKVDDPKDPPPRYEIICDDCSKPLGTIRVASSP